MLVAGGEAVRELERIQASGRRMAAIGGQRRPVRGPIGSGGPPGAGNFDPSAVPGLYLNLDAYSGITLGTAATFGGFESDFANAYWSKTNVTVTSDADGIADKIVEDAINATHILSRSPPTNFGVNAFVQRLYVEAKMDGRRWLRVSGNTGVARGWFDLQNGVVGSTNGLAAAPIMTSLGNGYYRCEISYQASDGDIRFTLSNADTGGASPTYLGDGVSGILMRNAFVQQDRVNTWADQETVLATHDFAQATVSRQGSYRVDLVGGRPAIDFDGVAGSDFMAPGGAAADWKFMHDGGGGYVFAVYAYLTGHTTTSPLLDNCSQTSANIGFAVAPDITNNRVNFFVAAGGAVIVTNLVSANASTAADTDFLQSCGYFEDGTASEAFLRLNRAYVGGSPVASTNPPSAANPTGTLALAARSGGATANAKVRVRQILVYKRTGGSKMTQTEIDYIENGLRDTWGTP